MPNVSWRGRAEAIRPLLATTALISESPFSLLRERAFQLSTLGIFQRMDGFVLCPRHDTFTTFLTSNHISTSTH